MDINQLIRQITGILGKQGSNLNILQHQVDIATQIEYFEYSKQQITNIPPEEVLERKEEIFDQSIAEDQRKDLIIRLAKTGDVAAYRVFEKFIEDEKDPLHNWGALALNECRMLLETSLLDEGQIYISSGLGGKGNKLRFFAVIRSTDDQIITESRQKVVRNEFDFIFQKYQCEIEEINFSENLCSIVALLPLSASVHSVFNQAIDECNQLGHFLKEELMISNVKVMNFEEIRTFLAKDKPTNEFPPLE